jgi:MYXO-CTERM domain-containing protein
MGCSNFTHWSPRRALVVILSLLLGGVGCGAPPEETAAEEEGGLRGELTVHIFDFGERSRLLHMLKLADGQQRELRFVDPPELPSGARLRVFGEDDGRAVAVSRFEVLGAGAGETLDLQQQALIDGPSKPPKLWAFVLVDTGAGVNLSADAARERLFSDRPDSIRSYYREVSYGLQELNGDVVGPFKITPPAGGLCENFSSVATMLLPMISGTYNQYLWYLGSRIANCPWEGVAQLGSAAAPTRHSFYNANSQCVVLVQEPGHNFGMVHSSSLRCLSGNTPASMIADSSQGQCTHSEYGNPFDPMGGGTGAAGLNRCYHMNGVQKAYQDWLGGCNVVKATTSGTFTIYPLEKPCEGIQLLQVPLPSARTLQFPPSAGSTQQNGVISGYYVELRAPVGLDAGLQTPRVFIVAAGDLRDARSRGNPNWLIDTAPETATLNDAALAVGKTFADPAPDGPKITVVSADATKAVIQVQLSTGGGTPSTPGRGLCGDDRAFFPPGPQECSEPVGPPINSSPTDGGTGGADAGMAGGGLIPGGPSTGAPPGGGSTAPLPGTGTATRTIEGGCACDVGGDGGTPGGGAALVALMLALRSGRRRRG